MKTKVIGIIAGVVIAALLLGTVLVFMMGGG